MKLPPGQLQSMRRTRACLQPMEALILILVLMPWLRLCWLRLSRLSLCWRRLSESALFVPALLLAAAPARSEPLAMMVYDRPPYMIDNGDGRITGLTADVSAHALKHAGLEFGWHKFAAKRILELVRENVIIGCGVGWFKTDEREQFAKFSRPIYRDKPPLAVAPKKFVLPVDTTIVKLLSSKTTRILVKEGFSYGALDPLLKKYQPTLISTSGEVVQMVQMIKANRADITFLPEEEALYLLEQAGFRADDFNLIKFPDMPRGETRHFMCSKNVPDSVMQKLDAAIRFETGEEKAAR